MRSAVYEGRVRHRRFAPRSHEFTYRLCLMYIDLAEVPAVFAAHPLYSARRAAAAWLRREDHFGDPAVPLDEAVRRAVADRTGGRPEGPVAMLAHLRYFGYCMNPVSFFYCFDAAGERVETIVTEIHNTPWGERHLYVLPAAEAEGDGGRLRFRFRKAFHVSPFFGMDYDYDWRFTTPGPALAVHMENRRDGKSEFDATLTLTRREIDRAALTRVLVRYPLMTARVIAAIYWQAFRLWRKGCPFFPHPRRRGAPEAAP
jgi:hypothetical protein